MARIRSIKPEFPQSESMGRVSRDARLTFIQLWTLSDDSGRLRGNSRMLASLLFPYDDDAPGLIGAWLDELERETCITQYKVEGQQYIQIANWLSHQKIDKPSPSNLPPFANIREESPNIREESSEDRIGMEGIGMEGRESEPSREKPRKRTFGEFQNVHLLDSESEDLSSKYGPDMTSRIIEKLSSYKASKGKTYKSDMAAIRQWVIETVGAVPLASSPPPISLLTCPVCGTPAHKGGDCKCRGCGFLVNSETVDPSNADMVEAYKAELEAAK